MLQHRQIHWVRWLPPALALLAGLLLFAAFRDHGFDDAYVTYRYAVNLAGGAGFVYNPGERILSTTAPLYALLLALPAALGLDVPLASNLVGCLGLAAGGLAIHRLGLIWGRPLAGAAGGLLYASSPLLLSTLGGEIGLLQALILWAFVALAARRPVAGALLLGLATLVRADGIIAAGWAGVCLAAGWARHAAPFRAPGAGSPRAAPPGGGLARAAAAYLLTLAPWLLFAWAYFGSPIPVTVEVKRRQLLIPVSRSFGEALLAYLGDLWALPLYRVLIALALAGLLAAALARRPWLLPVGWGLAYTLAYSLLGVSNYLWYLAPFVAALALAGGLGVDAAYDLLCRRGPPALAASAAGLLLALALAANLGSLAYLRGHPDPRLGVYRAAGEWLRANSSPAERVGTLEMGIIGYYSGRPMVDFAGLVQPEIAQHYGPGIGYDQSARYAIGRYRPALLVMQEQDFSLRSVAPELLGRCAPQITFSDERHPKPLTVYRCAW